MAACSSRALLCHMDVSSVDEAPSNVSTMVTIDEAFSLFRKDMEDDGLVDVTRLGSWSVSTYKKGCGVDKLLDNSPHTYWQSDGPQPHAIEVRFSKLMRISTIGIFADIASDESYTPSSITVYAGTTQQDLVPVYTYQLDVPEGWCCLVLKKNERAGILCFTLRMVINANHHNGKDTHVRAIRTFSPIEKLSEISIR